ncbi:unnamed protein product [Meloidogyne enterolobii]|uniref:Uncharacterized protein n=1 Tax=Meloidogyne enterolobii TaxID=390850 RepID=A0ACB0YZM7_MELEN
MNDLTDMGGKGFVWMCGKRRVGGGGRTVCVLVKVNGGDRCIYEGDGSRGRGGVGGKRRD